MENLIASFNKLSITDEHLLLVNQLTTRFDKLVLDGTIKENKKYLQMIFFSLEPCCSQPKNDMGYYQSRSHHKMLFVQASLFLVKGNLCPVMETNSFDHSYVQKRVQTYLEKQKNCMRKPRKIIPIFTTEQQHMVLVWMPSFRNEGENKRKGGKSQRSKLTKSQKILLSCYINRESSSPYPQYWLNQLEWEIEHSNEIFNPESVSLKQILTFIIKNVNPEECPELIDYLVDVPYSLMDLS